MANKKRDFERALRAAGLSHTQSKRAVSRLWCWRWLGYIAPGLLIKIARRAAQ